MIALAGASDDKTLELLHDAANKEEKRALGRYEDLKKDQKVPQLDEGLAAGQPARRR